MLVFVTVVLIFYRYRDPFEASKDAPYQAVQTVWFSALSVGKYQDKIGLVQIRKK